MVWCHTFVLGTGELCSGVLACVLCSSVHIYLCLAVILRESIGCSLRARPANTKGSYNLLMGRAGPWHPIPENLLQERGQGANAWGWGHMQ